MNTTPKTEDKRRALIFKMCMDNGEAAVRADVDYGGKLFHRDDQPIVREWLFTLEHEKNERVRQENAAATRRSIFWLAVSAIAAGIAALAALVTVILTYTHIRRIQL